jgi:acyl CoA:acetate/3-ketoacid CoA transferase alpha subunit
MNGACSELPAAILIPGLVAGASGLSAMAAPFGYGEQQQTALLPRDGARTTTAGSTKRMDGSRARAVDAVLADL